MSEQAPWEFQVHLVDGQKVEARVGADDFERIKVGNPDYFVPDDEEPHYGAGRLIYSMLVHRIDTRTGATGLVDIEGRNWIVPATSIVAFTYRDPSAKGKRPTGFQRIDPSK